MSVITLISVQNKDKNRCNVFVDGEFNFAAYIDLIIKYGLKKGDELSDNLKEEILNEDLKTYSFSLALKYLQRGLKTKKQVVDFLKRKSCPDNVIYGTIDRLKELDYITDVEYAKRYIETFSLSSGKRLLAYKLMSKGVKKADIEIADANVEIDSREVAANIAEKKLKNKTIDRIVLSKTFRYLIGKGFSYDDAEYATSRLSPVPKRQSTIISYFFSKYFNAPSEKFIKVTVKP